MFNKLSKSFSVLFIVGSLSACGGGGSESKSSSTPVTPTTPNIPSYTISGSGVKGPLIKADVLLYSFDATMAGGRGSLIAQAATNERAQITGLTISGELDPFYVLEFSSTTETLDVSTNTAPILENFSTIISSDQILSEQPIYASPLSSITLERARQKVIDGILIAEALMQAENEVKSFFGLGIAPETSLLSSAGMVSETSTSTEQQLIALQLRRAIEAFSILVAQLHESIDDPAISKEQLISAIASDMSDDVLDGIGTNTEVLPYFDEQINIFFETVNLLELPNTGGLRLNQLAQVMADETNITLDIAPDMTAFIAEAKVANSNFFSKSADYDGDGIANVVDEDDDNDSVLDSDDALPYNDAEYLDTDLDGIGDNQDLDDDGDNISDDDDLFPLDSTESTDFDLDGIGDNADLDDDNDSVPDLNDAFPLDATETLDTDLDGIGNNSDTDDDGDSHDDSVDSFPLDEYEWLDTDLDGIGNNADSDDDNDGVYDNDDQLPLDASDSKDFDGDGIGDKADNDDDNDGVVDESDPIHIAIPVNFSPKIDEELTFQVRGFYSDNTRLNAEDRWHVQYSVIDAERGERIQFYSDNNYYNASFSSSDEEWLITFPAPSYTGDFQLDITLYCSNGSGVCGAQQSSDSYYQITQTILFTIVCEDTLCGYQPEPEPGRNISASKENNNLVASVKRSNGDVITTYYELKENNWRTYLAKSTNNGYSWDRLTWLPSYALSGELIELSASKELLMLAKCSTDICMYRSQEGEQWSKKALFGSTNFANCLGRSCDINNISIKSMIESNDGQIIVTYIERSSGKDLSYITTTENLVNWSSPRLLFGEEEHSTISMKQLVSGEYVLAYYSNELRKSFISISSDLVTWNDIYESYFSHAELLEDEQGLIVFHQYGSEIMMMRSDDLTTFSSSVEVTNKAGYWFNAIDYGEGSFGLIYGLRLNFQNDVFHQPIDLN